MPNYPPTVIITLQISTANLELLLIRVPLPMAAGNDCDNLRMRYRDMVSSEDDALAMLRQRSILPSTVLCPGKKTHCVEIV